MPPGERRARHTRDGRDARTKGCGVRSASAHAKGEHPIEQCGYEGFGRRLAREVRERQRWADAFERAEVPEYHRGLAGPEAEDGLVGLPPFFVE